MEMGKSLTLMNAVVWDVVDASAEYSDGIGRVRLAQ